MQSKRIYDFGLHHGLDTKFYLAKGFDVVAVDADESFIQRAESDFAAQVGDGSLVLLHRAIWEKSGELLDFYINRAKDDWSSLYERNANRENTGVDIVKVESVSLSKLFEEYGVPYYLKCDLEGADDLVVASLCDQEGRPDYVSFEVSGWSGLETVVKLKSAGYSQMQLVNQSLHPWRTSPNPAREGNYVEQAFNAHMSGLFGRDLPEEAWMPADRILEQYVKFIELKESNAELAHGWLDVHARFGSS